MIAKFTERGKLNARRGTSLSINLFFSEQSWSSLVIADASSHNAKVLSAPKSMLSQLVARDELRKSGVYILTGPNVDDEFGLEGYIGESDNLAARLRSHARSKSFWNRAYVAVSKDSWLSKSHIRFLEARLIMQAKRAPLITRISNDKQDLSYDRLPDGEIANLENFVSFLDLIMPAIGCPLFSFPDAIYAGPRRPGAVSPSVPGAFGQETHFALSKGPARAVGYLRDNAFWVIKGSTARIEEYSSLREGYRNARRKLSERGILVRDEGRGLLVFTQDVPFNSPSDAAAVIGTTSLNGRKAWKVIGTNLTFAEWEASQEAGCK
ncbi:MAG: GIY-YIG nuclease family protein [Rhodocyclales bacterium]|nr:GIY-YIG nuclease family protein [Rhodocyclales bacterium]